MNTPLYQKFFSKLSNRYEINPNTILISKVIKRIPCHLLNQIIDNNMYYRDKEYLRLYYTITLSKPKLKKQVVLFNRYAHIYPNYSLLPEANFLYWNINHKQMLINNYEKLKNRKDKKYHKDKDRDKKAKIMKVLQNKDINKTTFFDFSVLQELYNTSIFDEIFFNDKKQKQKHTTNINNSGERDEDILFLIDEIEKIEKHQIKKQKINNSKQECNISSFWINDQKKYIQSQSKTSNQRYILTDSSISKKYSSIVIHKPKQKTPQINIKLNSYNTNLNRTRLQSSFNNQSQSNTSHYNNKRLVTIGGDNNRLSLRKAILTNQSVLSNSFRKKKQKINGNTITNVPSITSHSKSPRFSTTNNSLVHFKKPCAVYPTANTSRITTIPSLTEALKLRMPLKNLKLNPKVLSMIKLKIAKQKISKQ